jgi:multiple sugar transport system permease protein
MATVLSPDVPAPARAEAQASPRAPLVRARRPLRVPGARAAILFLAPALTAIVVFFVLPIAAALVMSFSDFDIYALGNPAYARLVGVENYLALSQDPRFWRALVNTFYFVLVGGPLTVVVALSAAMLLNSRLVRFKSFFRLVYFAPVVTTLVAVAVVWRYLYHPRFGLLNYLLGATGIPPIDWLGDPLWAMPAIILMAVWKNFGFSMLIFIAGLQNIPGELYEAAHVDGATGWQRFRHVTLPMLAPTFLFIGIITMIGYFQVFAEPYIMTQGGPVDSTLTVVLLLYEQGFRWWNMGFAAALAFMLFLVILVFTLIQLRLQRDTHV